MRNPDLGPPPARVHPTALSRLVPIWCGVVLVTVAMTVVQSSGVLLAMLWAATWFTSSAGLGLIVLADEQSGREHRAPTRLARR